MKAAMIGCGKLGFPVAMAWALKHEMVGYDTSPAAKEILTSRTYPHREARAQELLERTTFRIVDTVDEAIAHAEIVFIAVQTPHQPEFEGITRMPERRADFDYSALRAAVDSVANAAQAQKRPAIIVVISTCLPGTCDREIRPLLNQYTSFVYAPMFIAMGTTILDAMKPEFVLLGHNSDAAAADRSLECVHRFFREFQTTIGVYVPHAVMSVASAELTKCAYNVVLGLKIVAANSIMEIAHKVGANSDDVTNALALATDRVVSAKYLRGGMSDGGPCHPRDQIALSWLAEKLDLSYDLFGAMVRAREAQTDWLAALARHESARTNLPIVILGKAYKKGTNLTIGSPAILLRHLLETSEAQRAAEAAGNS